MTDLSPATATPSSMPTRSEIFDTVPLVMDGDTPPARVQQLLAAIGRVERGELPLPERHSVFVQEEITELGGVVTVEYVGYWAEIIPEAVYVVIGGVRMYERIRIFDPPPSKNPYSKSESPWVFLPDHPIAMLYTLQKSGDPIAKPLQQHQDEPSDYWRGKADTLQEQLDELDRRQSEGEQIDAIEVRRLTRLWREADAAARTQEEGGDHDEAAEEAAYIQRRRETERAEERSMLDDQQED